MAIEAHCGTLSALTLALPVPARFPSPGNAAERHVRGESGRLGENEAASHPRHRRHHDARHSARRKHRRGTGRRIPEVLVIGLRLADGIEEAPHDIVELIQAQRKSGIVFVCVRNVEFEGAMREEACFVVRRPLSERSGHAPTFHEFASAWIPSEKPCWKIADAAATTDDLWDSLCSQVIFGSTDFADLDARIVRASRIAQLRTQIAKLEGDHARAKTQERRNEAHAKLRKARAQLESLEQL